MKTTLVRIYDDINKSVEVLAVYEEWCEANASAQARNHSMTKNCGYYYKAIGINV